MENELKEQADDFIVASSVGKLDELEGTIASQASRIQELERQVHASTDDLGFARQLAGEHLRSLEERDAEVARLTEQQQAPPMIDSAAEVVELRQQLARAQAVRLFLFRFQFLFLLKVLIWSFLADHRSQRGYYGLARGRGEAL